MNKSLIIRPIQSQVYAHLQTNLDLTILITHDRYFDPSIDLDELRFLKKNLSIVEFTPISSFFGFIEFSLFLFSYLSENYYDSILSNNLKDLPALWFSSLFIPVLKKSRIIGISHNPTVWKSWISRKICIFYIRYFSDGFIALSTTLRDYLYHNDLQQKRVRFIPNAFHENNVQIKNTPPKKTLISISYIANIEPRKAQEDLIHIVSSLKDKYPTIVCFLVGGINDKKYKEKLNALVKEKKLEENVIFTGWLSKDEAMEIVEKNNIFVFPSHSEMMPRALIEAMWIGKPVVASSIDGILDLICNYENGIIVEPGNIQGFTQEIDRLFQDSDFANYLGENAKYSIRSKCKEEIIGKEFECYYKDLMKTSN
ncbi:glycosyltransferase family 4 protein [Leptolinea tardivitalis]|uniref:Glycosyl transferase family 1 domain-containing protein n=1 Tax=Leptolinea tardivitalis TaxID=229920 RepID=A0A0P6XJA1_9CHLR|nr:glycosyltransferase family 4 protein [Leptolinea tardivitalis]KPL71297.1 hypothetical protein ADM99_11375 [Leptolinea tardivitalis]GAP23069.1 glycosyltransferase [Leptolinea tardivitalis]